MLVFTFLFCIFVAVFGSYAFSDLIISDESVSLYLEAGPFEVE